MLKIHRALVLEKTVADARRLLDYAVSRGIVKDTSIITAIIDLEAKLASGSGARTFRHRSFSQGI